MKALKLVLKVGIVLAYVVCAIPGVSTLTDNIFRAICATGSTFLMVGVFVTEYIKLLRSHKRR